MQKISSNMKVILIKIYLLQCLSIIMSFLSFIYNHLQKYFLQLEYHTDWLFN